MRYFCTYFDHNYLPKGLALYSSLQKHCGNQFKLWVLCLSSDCHAVLKDLNFPNLCPVSLTELEDHDQGLLEIKSTRTIIEYYFTCTPCFPLFLIEKNNEIDIITYLDSDLFFFSDLEPIFQEIGTNSIAIIPHRFSPERKILERYGIYNVGWLSFRNDFNGLSCLEWYRARCLEWCFDRYEDGKFADQRYLDSWPQRFSGVRSLEHQGANLALWNISNYSIHDIENHVFVNNQPLIFFHFQGIRLDPERGYLASVSPNDVGPDNWETVWSRIYAPYIQALHESTAHLSQYLPLNSLWGSVRGPADMSWLQDSLQNLDISPENPVSNQFCMSSSDTNSFDIASSVVALIERALCPNVLAVRNIEPIASVTTPDTHSQRFETDVVFLNRLIECVNSYCIQPDHPDIATEIRQLRRQLSEYWLTVDHARLEEVYESRLGQGYRTLLTCGLQTQELVPEEQNWLQLLSERVKGGVEQPDGVKALMAAMLYYPPGKMQVQNAAERLPAWLLPDYQAVFESPEALAAIAQRQPPTPTSAPAAAPTNLAEDMVFLNRMLGCANLYYIDPDEQSIVEELRPIRRQVAEFWLSVPNDRVEAVFQSEFGKRYRSLLQCGFQNEPLKGDETAFAQALGQRVAAGIEQPDGLKAFLGVMLYYPPGKMQVRDAATRLPSWLLPDYQAVFEVSRPEPLVPGTLPQEAIAQGAPAQSVPDPTVTPAIAPPPANALDKLEDMVFLNRLLGLTNLYEIDPTDTAIADELREMRSQVTQLWLSIPDDRLEAAFNSEFGRRYGAYLRCGFQREALTPEETQTLQQLAQQVASGLEKPAGVKAFLGAMMYYPPGKMKVSNADQRLPLWLLPTYRAVFEEGATLPA
jgi:hypothetical protein